MTIYWLRGPDLRMLLRCLVNRRAGVGVLGSAADGLRTKIVN
jgi:hypothetical protein